MARKVDEEAKAVVDALQRNEKEKIPFKWIGGGMQSLNVSLDSVIECEWLSELSRKFLIAIEL